jgi:hypothetical protein
MASSYEIFTSRFEKTIIDAVYQEIVSKTATYYHWFGKENGWTDFLSPFIPSSTNDIPGQPSYNFRYELHVRRDILTAKKIKPSDVSYVIRRIDWEPNTVYDMYDDAIESSTGVGYAPAPSGATKLEDANFYVLTSQYNVYKCIWNNSAGISTVMPTGTTHQIFTTADGYRWKFMYSLPISLRNKFLSTAYMPVTTALKAPYYSGGSITSISIDSGGIGYNAGTTTATITGNGYKEENPYIINSITIADAGDSYSTTPTITISEPYFANEWASGANILVGTYIKHFNSATQDTNYYYIISGTLLGTSGPTHTTGTVTNGSAQLKYVGTRAKASCVLSGTAISTITLAAGSFGYTSTPTVTTSAGITKDADYAINSAFSTSDIIKSGLRYYTVTTGGTTGTTAPTHTSGAVANGTTLLTYLGRDANLTAVTTKTNAEITLEISPGTDAVFRVDITSAGTKYSEVPTITFTAPVTAGGVTATGTVVIGASGAVSYVTINDPGNGYTSTPTCTITTPKITFNGATAVDDTAETITYNAHKFVTGDSVTYNNGGGTSITGLTSGNTTAGSFVTSGRYIIRTLTGTTQAEWNTAAGTSGLTYAVGDIFTAAAAGAGTGTAQRVYYVIRMDANIIKLATTSANASAGTAIDLTDGIGTAHTLTLTNGAALGTVYLGTGGEIVGYTITNPGIGYTDANITVTDSSASGSGAALSVDLDIGNVNTLQSNVELLAVPGSIEAVVIEDGGTGYGAATVEILGDGQGATATATVTGGKVIAINIVNSGSGYTWTDVVVSGGAGTGCLARAIMSPLGGHGFNAVEELYARSLQFYTAMSKDLNQGIEITNDYRKAGLIRNLKKYGTNQRFTDEIGSGCVLITGQFDKLKLYQDMLLLKTESSGVNYKKYRIVDFNDTQILLSVFNNFSINVGDVIVTDPTNGGLITSPELPVSTITVESVSERTIDQFSGDFIFFSVREPYAPSDDQIVTIRTTLAL